MTGKKLKITRSYESLRFAPPKTIDSRALDFLKTQNFKIDFSASISTKALNSKTKPAADNKPKRKKGNGPIKRYGVAVFDPNARWTPGKVFIPWIMKHNRMMGDDKPNVGWIEAPKTIEPKNVSQTVKNLIAINKNKSGYKFRDSKPNPRTGGFEQKALGPSIGTIIPGGDIGARAASKLGLVVDSLGKLRCPPGVPAANQFTDSIGSNCFDFMPDVAKRLLGEAIQFGREQMSHLSLVNNMEQTARRQNGLIVPSDNNLVVSSSKNLILPHILGPDGKILSTVTTIEPIIYAETVRAQLARDYPNIDMEERERIVKLAEQKAGMIQGVNSRIKIALDYLKELGIEFDENNPQSLTAGLISAIKKLKEDGWDIDYQNLLWGANLDTDSPLSMDEKVALHARGVIDTAVRIVLGNPERHFSEEELSKIFPDLDGDPDINIKTIANAISNNDLSRLGPGQKKVALKVMERVNDYWATEHGFLMSILAEHKQNPVDMELIQTFGLMDPTDPINFGTEAMVIPTDDGKLGMFFNPIGMMMNEPPSMPTDGKWRMYTGDGKGLEIEQIQAISRVVDAGQRKQLLNEFLRQTNDSAKEVDEVIGANASKHLNSIMEKNAGKLGRAMWIFQHELTHARQYSLLAYLISHDSKGRRLKGMTNADVFSLVDELIGGRNSILNMESILSDPKIISSAFAEMGPIVEKLVENGMAGVYPQQHLNALNILSEILNLPPSQRIDAADKIAQEVDLLQKAKDANFITPQENQRLNALIYAENAIIEILNNPENNTLESAIRQQRALMFAEAIAELNASVKMGLIQPTDEIKQVLEHINGPMDQVHKFKNSLEEHGKLKINYSDGKISFNRNRRERTKGDITGESYTERKKRLIGEEDPIVVMDSTESFNSKKTLISRFGELREKIIQRATEKQKLAISQELPEQNNAKILNQDGSLIAELADSSDIRDGINNGKTFDKKLEEDIIPILDLMEANPLDKDVAVVVDIGDIKGSKNPNRMTFLEFVNFVRAGIALNKQKYQTDDFPQTNQKMVVKVPKGSRGIPDFDFAPNSNKDKSISETLSEALSKITDDDIYDGPEGKIRPYRGEDKNDLELTDADVEELYKRYEKDRDLRKKQRQRRQIPKTTPEEEEAQVAREQILGMASVRQGLKSSKDAASIRSREILERAKNKNIDIDAYERDRMPTVDSFGKNTQNGEFNLGEFRPLISEEEEIERSKKIQETILSGGFTPQYDKSKFIKVDDKFILENWFYGDEKKGFGVRLHIAKQIAIAKGDSKKVEQIDKLIADVKKMSAEEFNIAVKEASLRLSPQFNQMISVQVDDPIKIIQSGRYLTVHEREKMKLAGARGLSERDRFDIETVIRARSGVEQQFLGIKPDDTSPETTELRPASGYVSTQIAVKKRLSLLQKKYGEDIDVQHPYAIGEAAKSSSANMGRYGDAQFILRPEVSERTLVFRGDSIANTGSYSPALKLSSIDNSQHREMYFDPMSILYADRTGDMSSIASPAENLPKDGKGDYMYQEAMILGSFDAPDVAAIVISPQEARESYGQLSFSGYNQKADQNITSLIASAQLRENFSDKGIDLVIDSQIFPLDEIEPFNAAMTKLWVKEQIEKNDSNSIWRGLTAEQLIVDDETTPYEAYLRAVNAKYGEGAKLDGFMVVFDHPDNENENNEKNQKNLSAMINSELERLQSKKENPSVLSQGLRSGSAPVINSQDSRGSIASMLLAPGKIKIEGEREDGTLVGRLIQQNTPMQSLSKLENKLQAVIDNPGANGSHKVEAERALNVIKARKNAESNIGLRSSSNQSRDYVREMPSTINYNSQQILERLEDNGATWGEPLSDALAEMNQNPIQEIIVRTTNEKIEQGPKILINGRDKNGTPLMAGVENLQKEFGKTNAEINNYFIKKHGVRIDIQDKFLSAQGSDGQKQKSVIYGALQAINDLFENINIKSLTKRDNLKISFSDFITGENSLGEFGPKEKLFSRTTYGDNKTKSRVLINQNAISEMSMQRVWLDMKSNDSKINHVDQFFAKLGIPKGFDPIFPGEDSPDFEKWQSLENQFLQRIAYGIAIHEIAHYLDFTQRDPGDNPVSVPPSLRKLITGKKPEGRLDDGLFQSTSSGVSESLRDMPSVSKYGLTNNQEKLAEGFLSWFLFGGTKLGTTPVSGDRTSYRYEQNAEKFQETVSDIVTPLLEKLGPRVKSAKQTNKTSSSATTNELPAQIFVYAILPFIKMFENRNLDKNMSKKYLNGFDIKALSSSNAQKISDSTKYEQDQDSMVFIDKEIKKLLLAIKKDKKLNKKILPNVLKEIQSMTDTELKTALVKASRQFVAGLDKRPRYFLNDNNENLEITNSDFDKFVKRGSWDSNSEKQNDTTVIDSEYGVRLGIPKGAEDAVNPVRGFLLHSDEIKNRKIKIQAEVEKKKNNFEKRGINPQKIKPEYLPQSIYLGLHGTKDSLNPFPIQRGETEIILKPEIAHRTLATFGDSVSGARTPFNLDNEDNDERLLVAMLRNRWLDNEQNGNTSSVKLTTQQKMINLLNAYIGKIGYGDVTKDEDGARGFVEAIIAGGFNLDEVEEIHLSANYVKKHINIQLNEPDLTEATKILTRFSIKNDLINAENIILNPKTPEETRAAGEMKKKIIYIQQLKKQREARIKFSRKINSAVRGGVGPKIIFVNEDGLDYDDPKTYKNYIDGMTVDELLDERMASDIREILKTIGKPVASSEQVIAFRRENNKMKTGVNS